MKEVISNLIEERLKFIKIREESWSEEEVRYTIPEPKEVKELGDEIKALLSEHKNTLPVDFILESLTHLGDAPQVIYDDNGHFAVSGNGYSPVPMTESGKFETDESFTTVVTSDQWFDTIREALKHYLK